MLGKETIVKIPDMRHCLAILLGLVALGALAVQSAGAAEARPHSSDTDRVSVSEPEGIRVAPGGWTFQGAASGDPFIPFGVNYYDPQTYHAEPYPAYDVIGEFDPVRTDRHFGQISDLGANVVRVFLSAASFEPVLFELDEASFGTLDELIALAKKHGLYVILDLTDTWEGEPEWQSWEYFADETTLQGFEFLMDAFGERYSGEQTVLAWNLHNEPAVRGPDSGIMGDLFGPWVRLKYGSEANLRDAWSDYPRTGESWGTIQPPTISTFTEQESPGDRRYLDFQLFREDIAYNWVRRLTDALRTADANHMITVGLDQHSVPFKPDVDFYKPYTGFNPHKLAPLLDYVSIHGYNWWGRDVDEYMEGLLRYSYAGMPVVVEEFDLAELDASLAGVQRSASGWLHWAAYESPAGWPSFLFDASEVITALGDSFQSIADGSPVASSTRPADVSTVVLDLEDVLVSRAAQDSVYRAYVTAAGATTGPVGFDVRHFRPPNLLRIVAPSSGEQWRIGDTVTIAWDAVDWPILYDMTVDVALSRDGGATWETISSGLSRNTGDFTWTVSEPTCDKCLIGIADHEDGTVASTQSVTIAEADTIFADDFDVE